jgi:hypothetical protein
VSVNELKKLSADAADFATASRPRPVPRFLAMLCLFVVAASRMRPDEERPTNAYYPLLRQLLHLQGSGEPEGFEYVPRLFSLLAEWLRDDERGCRGSLILPETPTPKWVGYPISQTVFRQRDRQVLSRFFDERLGRASEGIDVLRVLRRWGGRHALTDHAEQVLSIEEFAPRVRAAIASALRSWDGTIFEASGIRAWPERLSLEVSRSRLLVSSSNATPLSVLIDGKETVLQTGGVIEMPSEWLSRLVAGPLRLPLALCVNMQRDRDLI